MNTSDEHSLILTDAEISILVYIAGNREWYVIPVGDPGTSLEERLLASLLSLAQKGLVEWTDAGCSPTKEAMRLARCLAYGEARQEQEGQDPGWVFTGEEETVRVFKMPDDAYSYRVRTER